MTLHWLGAVFIIIGSGLEGFRRSYLLSKRQQILIEFAQAFTWMENEIVKRQTPIIEIVQAQMERKGEVAKLFQLFYEQLTLKQLLLGEAWDKAVEQYFQSSVLLKEDLEWIRRIGDAIQPFDRQSIEREMSFIIDILRNRHLEARNRAIQFGKLYKTLGVMGGVLVVLLLS
ncbi:hypothetical protein E2R51_02550 [Jeotgalibacillus sp. S-D1]|uniref:stage III sporulation protein AB n=1 Tax=Jeotgalibacillus sp. S-D1 TaxID=2552189 RepID=UPI001059F5E0|nr:stage III sporulation protein AB [Jeotgalibacillus sp. S-D1]TDL34618.1 hypothetical protein E2R51_02550 [Jeotgalibacillus sp. S-D1]